MEAFTTLLFSVLIAGVYSCKSVLIVNGIIDPTEHLLPLKANIKKDPKCPNRNVTIIDENHGLTSTIPLWTQVDMYKKAMLPHFEANPDGIHVIGYSQGSILSRAVIENTPDHPVHVLISLAGVQFGVNRVSGLPPDYFGLKDLSTKVCYNAEGQSTFSGCNFWRDVKYFSEYLKECVFLPKINNEIDHENATMYKNSLLKLKKFVMIAGPDDQIVTPWESGLFGFENADGEIVKMEDQEIYKKDTLGLKTLNEKKVIFQHTVPGVHHLSFPTDEEVCEKYINPYLD